MNDSVKYTVKYKTQFETRTRTKKVDCGKDLETTKFNIVSSLKSDQRLGLISITFVFNGKTYTF